MREFFFLSLGWTWFVWSLVARVCWVCVIVKFLKLNAGRFMHGSGLGLVWGCGCLGRWWLGVLRRAASLTHTRRGDLAGGRGCFFGLWAKWRGAWGYD